MDPPTEPHQQTHATLQTQPQAVASTASAASISRQTQSNKPRQMYNPPSLPIKRSIIRQLFGTFAFLICAYNTLTFHLSQSTQHWNIGNIEEVMRQARYHKKFVPIIWQSNGTAVSIDDFFSDDEILISQNHTWLQAYMGWHEAKRHKFPDKQLLEHPDAPKVAILYTFGFSGGLQDRFSRLHIAVYNAFKEGKYIYFAIELSIRTYDHDIFLHCYFPTRPSAVDKMVHSF